MFYKFLHQLMPFILRGYCPNSQHFNIIWNVFRPSITDYSPPGKLPPERFQEKSRQNQPPPTKKKSPPKHDR